MWASVVKDPETVIGEAFEEALERDPHQQKQWVALVDDDGETTDSVVTQEMQNRSQGILGGNSNYPFSHYVPHLLSTLKQPPHRRYSPAVSRRHLDIPTTVTALYSDAIAASAIDFAVHKQCDAIVLGASREGLLSQAIHNIPDAIARGSDCTVIVVRKAIAEPDTEGS